MREEEYLVSQLQKVLLKKFLFIRGVKGGDQK